MDHSTNQSANSAQLRRDISQSPYSFLDGIQNYSSADGLQAGNDGYDLEFNSALFSTQGVGQGYPQENARALSQPFQQDLQRQQSPALPQFNNTQSTYQQPYYSQHHVFDSRSMSQSPFEQQYIPRQTHSPFEAYQYQLNPSYSSPPFGNQQQLMQQPQLAQQQASSRQSQQTSRSGFNQQSQSASSSITMAARQSPYGHLQNSDLMHFPGFSDQNNRPQTTFVNPSMLSANTIPQPGPNTQYQPYPQYFFPKSNNTLDPRALQSSQAQNIAPPQQLQQQQQPSQQQQQHFQHLQQPQSAHYQQQILSASTTSGAQDAADVAKPRKARKPKDPNAPKRVRTKKPKFEATKDGTTPEAVSVSESDSSDEEDLPDPPPALLIVAPPTEERGKALWHAVHAVWTPHNKPAPTDKVRNGLAAFGETVRSLRDAWKAKNDSLKKAELPNSPTAKEAPQLKEDVARYRQTMEQVMSRSNQFGHPTLVKRLGENHFTLSALHSFLLDRVQVADYDSTLVSSILRFAVNFEGLDESMLETTKWTKILQRIAKKATNESKDFAQRILTNATAVTARKKVEGGAETPASPKPINGSSTTDGTLPQGRDSIAGVKRPREGEPLVAPLKKTVVRPASKPLALQAAERRKAQEAGEASKAGKTAGAAVTAPVKAKASVVAPPKTNLLSSLMSASKRPGTSLAERAAAAKDKPTATPATTIKDTTGKVSPLRAAPAAPSAKSQSSFMSFLEDMDKKQVVEPKKEEVIQDETEEQRSKRLRREARRILRVTWKPDSELVATRLFTHDPDEEIDGADSLMRDAGDTGKEGEMLKLHKDMDDLEEEEEEEAEIIGEDSEYAIPSTVDLSTVDEDLSMNYIKYGGPVDPDSPAKKRQQFHEQSSVMVVYDGLSEKPTSPKEPPPDDDDDAEFQPTVDFGEPDKTVREKEKAYYAKRDAPAFEISASSHSFPGFQNPQQPVNQTFDLSKTLSMLGQFQQPQQQAPQPQPGTIGGVDLSKLLAVMQKLQPQQGQQAPQPQYQPPAPAQTPVIPSLAGMLAQMNQNQPQQQQAALALGSAGNPNPYPGAEEASRKHSRNDSADGYDDSRGNKNKKKKGGDKFDANGLPKNYKTQVCSFWREGKCLKGDDCTYRHDEGR